MSVNLIGKAKNAISGVNDRVAESIKDIRSSLTKTSKESQGDGGRGILVFPPELRSASDNVPLIEFTAYERNISPGESTSGEKKPGGGFHRIYLPAPSDVAFQDNGTFNALTLDSATAKVAADVIEGGASVSSAFASVMSGLKANATAIAASKIPGGIGKYAEFATKSIKNPNTNTSFEGNNIRSFSFSFKMVARSQQESEMIKQIQETFRYFSYADLAAGESNLYLSYPAPWTIRFMDMSNGVENPYIPGIWSCYLTACSTTMNAGQNMYFSDNAPTSVDLALTFQETRVLSRDDLIDVKKSPHRGIINGKATTLTPSQVVAKNITQLGGNN